MSKDWSALVDSGKIEELTNSDLKAYLKEMKQPQNGEKATLLSRIKMYVQTRQLEFDLGEGATDPFALSLPALRKACAKFGASPIGDRDEMLRELVEKLKAASGAASGSAGAGAAGGSAAGGGAAAAAGGSGSLDAVEVAKRVIQLGEKEDYEAVLSVLEPVTSASPTASLRKQYLRLSALIHPDKLGRRFDGATKAFQVLVSAFERLSQPELYQREQEEARKGKKGKDGGKGLKITRSNEGCYRTSVRCPRCREQWGTPLSGLPPYSFNFMMQGYKQFCCDTCLFSFGCVTATHECPHCKAEFAFHPNDYHRKIRCESCEGEFGFYQYPVSERVENELREELKKEQERWMRKREQSQKRSARAERNTVFTPKDAADVAGVAEGAFAKGLTTTCPRCGEGDFERTADQAAHLLQCTDKAAHRAYKRKRQDEEAATSAKAAKTDAQDAATSRAAFDFLGGRTQDVWRLNEPALRHMAAELGLSTDGTHEKLVTRVVKHRNALDSSRLLTDGTTEGVAAGGGASGGGGGRKGRRNEPLTRDSLPENLENASEDMLRATCAAHGLKPRGGIMASKKDLIRAIEKELFRGGEAEVLLLDD